MVVPVDMWKNNRNINSSEIINQYIFSHLSIKIYMETWLADIEKAKKRAQILVYFNPNKTMMTNEWPELVTVKILEYIKEEKTAKSWLHLFPELKRWQIVQKTIRRLEEDSKLRRRYYGSWKCLHCHHSFLLKSALDFHVYMSHIYPTLSYNN